MKKINLAEKAIAKVSYATAKKSANQVCWLMFHQTKLPEAVKKLRKF